MNALRTKLRRLFAGRTVLVAFAALLAGSLLVGSFVPAYLAKAFASSVRNAHFAGTGPLFYAVAGLFLYVEAVVVAAVYRALRAAYERVERLAPGVSPRE